ncbi:MAG: beta-propeller domain-containing protein [Actinobacteria bacterium]|nr:beta-propeller domain-containing protein [Actinomycetota bacterium]
MQEEQPVVEAHVSPIVTRHRDYSGTNVQEKGVDEPDLEKSNGNTLFAVATGS